MTKEQVFAELEALSDTDTGWVMAKALHEMTFAQHTGLANYVAEEYEEDYFYQCGTFIATKTYGGPPRAPITPRS